MGTRPGKQPFRSDVKCIVQLGCSQYHFACLLKLFRSDINWSIPLHFLTCGTRLLVEITTDTLGFIELPAGGPRSQTASCGDPAL
jgi:hypothetical protein